MSFTGQVMGGVVGRLPASMIRSMASQYAAGATLDEAMAEVRSLQRRGMASTVAVLGEAASTERYAAEQVRDFLSVVGSVHQASTDGEDLDVRLGVKPTALGIDVSREVVAQSLDTLAFEAAARGVVVEVDMEQLSYVEGTLSLVREARAAHGNVNAVVQAYLHRTADDVASLVEDGIPARIVKGTYKEGPRNAFQLYDTIRENYVALVRQYLEAGVWVGIATHDEYVIAKVLNLVRELGVSRDRYEFQMIMGVQETLRQSLVDGGHAVRVTVHFGSDLHLWSVRRLKENPEIAKYAITGIRDSVREKVRS